MYWRFAGTKKAKSGVITRWLYYFSGGGGGWGVHCNSFYPRERWVKKVSRLGYFLLYSVLACFCCCITFFCALSLLLSVCLLVFFFNSQSYFVTLLNESSIQFLKLSPQRRGVCFYYGWLWLLCRTVWELRRELLICARNEQELLVFGVSTALLIN